jgi:hypothetical protein
VDQLRKILNRIDVVMRRGTNQAHARCGVANAGDRFIHLVARQFAPFARLGALGHLDLQFVRVGEIVDRHAKPAGRHLLDR